MLPFLKSKKDKTSSSGLIIKTREPDEKSAEEMEKEQSEESYSVEACAQELINAIHAKDAKAVSTALKDLMDVMEIQPEDNSYSEQNKKLEE